MISNVESQQKLLKRIWISWMERVLKMYTGLIKKENIGGFEIWGKRLMRRMLSVNANYVHNLTQEEIDQNFFHLGPPPILLTDLSDILKIGPNTVSLSILMPYMVQILCLWFLDIYSPKSIIIYSSPDNEIHSLIW